MWIVHPPSARSPSPLSFVLTLVPAALAGERGAVGDLYACNVRHGNTLQFDGLTGDFVCIFAERPAVLGDMIGPFSEQVLIRILAIVIAGLLLRYDRQWWAAACWLGRWATRRQRDAARSSREVLRGLCFDCELACRWLAEILRLWRHGL